MSHVYVLITIKYYSFVINECKIICEIFFDYVLLHRKQEKRRNKVMKKVINLIISYFRARRIRSEIAKYEELSSMFYISEHSGHVYVKHGCHAVYAFSGEDTVSRIIDVLSRFRKASVDYEKLMEGGID